MSTNRLHSLDALRAFALLLGVVFHSTLAHLLPPGLWAVGTTSPSPFLGWFTFYIHCFRLEMFFLLAGFFGAMVVQKRGMASYVRDRFKRILLVFVVFLYPMKFALASVWVIGGLHTGWLTLPPEAASASWWQLALGGLGAEHWPNLQLTHLWFLYYLACLTGLFLLGRWLIGLPQIRIERFSSRLHPALRGIMSGRWAPLALALVVTPIITRMKGPSVDTPDQSLALSFPVLAGYGVLFALGWWLFDNRDLPGRLARRWHLFLTAGVLVSIPASVGTEMVHAAQLSGDTLTGDMRWLAAAGVGLTMAFSVFGWLGCFVRFFETPSAKIRYLADASYWIYVAHLPLLVALQIATANLHLPWFIDLPLVNLATFSILIASYHLFVRFTWLGVWLNGRRYERASPPPSPVVSAANSIGSNACTDAQK